MDLLEYESDQICELPSTIFNKRGVYHIKVKAIDTYGAESEWSDPVDIIVTKYPLITRLKNW